jgi:RNA polymerase primary sigma factor
MAATASRPLAATGGETVARLLAESRRRPLLSAAQEVELGRRVEAGDRGARERMILSNVRLVISIARKFQHRGTPFGDLVQEGIIGLIRAVDDFDWRRGVRFSTYGTIRIRKYVHAAAERDLHPFRVPRPLTDNARLAFVTEGQLTVRLRRVPTEAEISDASGLSGAELREARIVERAPVALDRPVDEEGVATVGDLIADPARSPEARTMDRWRTGVLSAAVASLSGNERRVIELRFDPGGEGPGRSFEEIGRAIGLSSERARQIEERALRRLSWKRDLAALGPER